MLFAPSSLRLDAGVLDHLGPLWISAGMNFSSSSGVLVSGVMASVCSRSWMSARLMKGISTPLTLSMIGRGVPARATTENQPVAAKPGRPASAMVGTSGMALIRVGDVTP
jgi:hypothetical protein